jgi:hypothetical protein
MPSSAPARRTPTNTPSYPTESSSSSPMAHSRSRAPGPLHPPTRRRPGPPGCGVADARATRAAAATPYNMGAESRTEALANALPCRRAPATPGLADVERFRGTGSISASEIKGVPRSRVEPSAAIFDVRTRLPLSGSRPKSRSEVGSERRMRTRLYRSLYSPAGWRSPTTVDVRSAVDSDDRHGVFGVVDLIDHAVLAASGGMLAGKLEV